MRSMPVRTLAAIGLLGVIVAVAVASGILVTRPPSVAVMTATPAALALGLFAGIALGAAGAVAWALYRDEPFGALATLCAGAWFAGWWASPGAESAVAFTAGLVLASAWPAVACHGILSLRHWPAPAPARRLVVAGYLVCIGLLGLVPALLGGTDAACPACPRNLVAVVEAPDAARAIETAGLVIAAAWVGIVNVVAARWLRESSPAGRRALLPLAVPGLVALVAFGVDAAWSAGRGVIGVDRLDEATWAVSAVALVGLAAASMLRVFRARRTRSAVAQIVVDLAGGGAGSRLEHRLRAVIGDAGLRVAYPADGGSLVDAEGNPFSMGKSVDRRSTPLVRDGLATAVLDIAAARADDVDGLREVLDGAALALEHERLLALSRARLRLLRTSRARVVEANDLERRRLERDLHDGAQQRLAGLVLSLGLARAHATGEALSELEAADAEVRAAIAETREIGHGMYPASLADLGLAAAIQALSEASPTALSVDAVPSGRLPWTVESAAYFVVAEAPRLTGARAARVEGELRGASLRLRMLLEDAAAAPDLTELEDRVGALDGTILATPDGSSLRLEAEIPCAS